MRIVMKADGRVFEGTAIQIVQQMQSLAFGWDGKPLGEYIDWAATQLERMEGVKIDVLGAAADLEGRARWFIQGMVDGGMATRE